MRADLDNAAVADADDAVAAAHRRQTMGDDDDRAVLGDAAHVALNDPLAVVIERRGRLVENEMRGLVASARAMAMRCLCPPERLAPRSSIEVS